MTLYTLIIISIGIGLLLGSLVIPRMMMISIKDDFGRRPDDISTGTYKAIQVAGLSLFPVLLMTLCASLMVPMCFADEDMALRSSHMVPRVFQLITGCTMLFIVGLKYDMHGTSSFIRAAVVIGATCIFPASNMWINNLHGLFGIDEISIWIGAPLTIIIATFIIEVFRLLDGIDGLASTIGVTVLALLLCVCAFSEGMTPAVVCSSTLAVTTTFWAMKLFSKKWNRGFMGNSGSYILGYIVAYLAIVIANRSNTDYIQGSETLVFAILALPCIDIIRVIGARAREGRSITTPDRNQLNHLLLRTGATKFAISLIIMLLPVLYTAISFTLLHFEVDTNIIMCVSLLLVLITECTIRYFIRRHEEYTHQTQWNKEYGEDAWNACIPYEQIETKQKVYGTMGLPTHIIEATGTAFIPDGMNSFERNTKRLFDMLVSGLCLIIFSPLFLLSYILIKLDDGGPAIYKQERLGRFGRPFNIYKYRSMRLDAEKMGPQLSHTGGEDDPRLTKIGGFLRRHHLDELPQLWNVFKGDMAFIGYRPERKFFIDQIMEHDPRYSFLYQIRPGVTSYATLYNGYTDTMEKMLRRLELDLYYLGHRSFWLDCKILFLTFASIIFGKKF